MNTNLLILLSFFTVIGTVNAMENETAQSNSRQAFVPHTDYGTEESRDILKGFRVEKERIIEDLIERNMSLKSQLFMGYHFSFETPATNLILRPFECLFSETNHFLVIADEFVESIFADSKERVLSIIHDLDQENLALHEEVNHHQMQSVLTT